MRVALDATYSVDPHPSGIAIYSRELMKGLAQTFPGDRYLHCFRPKQFLRSSSIDAPNASRRLLIPPSQTFKADLFHALNQRVDKRPAKRLVTTFHDLFVITGNYSTPEFQARFTEQAQVAARNSDLIIAVSEFTADQVSYLLEVDRARIRVVPHGVHTPNTTDGAKRENVILSVGALQVRKNVGRLVQAFELLSDKSWRLVLAGAANGYGAAGILEQIQRSPARERIEVTGYLSNSDLERWYSRAKIFAFPSLDEGFGIPVLEAMAHGVPVITSKRSALEEVAGDAALLIDPKNVDELSGAIERLMSSNTMQMDLTARGLVRAAGFSWERSARATHAVYEELLG